MYSQPPTPNHISRKERVSNFLFSLLLLAYGTYGAMHGDIYLPGKRTTGIHLHGVSMWVMYAAMLSAIANMLSVIVDHYDIRNNETNYKLFARITQFLGWSLFVVAGVLHLFVFRTDAHY